MKNLGPFLVFSLFIHGTLGLGLLLEFNPEIKITTFQITWSRGAKARAVQKGPGKQTTATEEAAGPATRFNSDVEVKNISRQIESTLVYPAMARRMGWQGRVKVRVWLTPEGTISRIRILESSGHDVLDQAVVKAVRRFRFPAGVGIEQIDLQPVRFLLE